MSDTQPSTGLRRVLTFWPLVLYGLGVIVGAGIYVAIGLVIDRAGDAAPLSFLLAGVAACFTGLCYAELSGRFPVASGAVVFVTEGFGSAALARLTGAAVTLAVVVSAASIARGAVDYLSVLLPLPLPLLTVLLISGFTAIALRGVGASVGLAVAMSVIEIAGLLAATIAGLHVAPDFQVGSLLPQDAAAWRGTAAGAFIAFFAFTGFETLANLAEEVKDPGRTVPRGIIGAVAASMLLYLAVSTAVVLGDSAGNRPLLGLFKGAGVPLFAAIGSIAVANGVLVQIVTLSRLFYGMACNGHLPAALARIAPGTQTPDRATLVAGGLVLATALLVPFEHLLVLTNLLTLGVFTLVDLALWRLQWRDPARAGFHAPGWVPPLAALLSIALILAELAP
ncbi:MAG: APC family permease [Acetobacteraceae bacterium]|nr:APC family permease [Acetobacteraceae bacterium]